MIPHSHPAFRFAGPWSGLLFASLLILVAFGLTPLRVAAAPPLQAVTVVPATVIIVGTSSPPVGGPTPLPPPPPPAPNPGGGGSLPSNSGSTAPPAAVTTTPTPAPCADRYDASGPDTAPPIVNGETQTRVLCPAGEIEWASFYAAADKTYGITTAPGSIGELDTELWVLDRQLDNSLAELAYNDDDPHGAPGFSRLTFTAPHDGWYLIRLAVKGGIGYDGLLVQLRVDLLAGRTNSTPTIPPYPGAGTATAVSRTATALAVQPTLTVPLTVAAPNAAGIAATGHSTPTLTPDPLLHPLPGSAQSGELPVVLAGDADPSGPDRLDQDSGNDTLATAAPLAVGLLYQYLNFIPRPGQPWDSDFYAFQAKAQTCYQVFTRDLSPGLDTTLVLWRATVDQGGATPVIKADLTRTPLAQNDDAAPGTADTSSLIRWCSHQDSLVVVEAHTHHWQPLLDLRHRTYGLGVMVAPPTPTPSPVPTQPPPLPANAGEGLIPNGSASLGTAPPFPTMEVVPASGNPAPEPPSPTLSPSPTPVPPSVTPTGTPSATPTRLPSVTPTATATPQPVTIDVVAYFTAARSANLASGPNPNTAIPHLQVLVVDLQTNRPFAEVWTDAYGHATLQWNWHGPVQIAVPQLQQAHLVEERDLAGSSAIGGIAAPAGHLYLPIRAGAYPPPGICP